jgi:hypothetical protein
VFDASSMRFCNVCSKNVKIGFGSEANWNFHVNSEAHKRAEKSNAPKASKISNFFSKVVPESQLAASPLVAPAPAPLNNPYTVPLPQHSSPAFPSSLQLPPDVVDVDAIDTPIHSSEVCDLSLVKQLWDATAKLPESQLIATRDDELFRFSGDAYEQFKNYEDPWEGIDKELNTIIGWSREPEDIAKIIRCGPLGMDGLCNWLEVCINRFETITNFWNENVNNY